MPNQLTADGLELATREEIVEGYEVPFQTIYGDDVNLESDTPDGQWIGIMTQIVLDVQDLLLQIYNSFDPDLAIGDVLDQRVAINGIQRQAGTHTVTNITLVISQSVNLYGVDQELEPVYTVSDNAGNEWELQTTQLGISPATHVYSFRAKVPGAVLSVPNTITIPVTIVIGVDSINNPTTYTTLGINEESDAALKVRRQRSVSLSSQGYLAGLQAALENINGVTSAFIHENDTGSTDGDGVPGHTIWVIVAGDGEAAEIAQAIYRKRNAGCGMFGSISYDVTQPDGSLFTVYWDDVEPEDLFIRFTATSLDGVNDPNVQAIREGLVTSFVPGVNQQVNVNDLATKVQEIDPNTLVTSAGFSTTAGGSYTNTLDPSALNKQFVVEEAHIIILPILLLPHTSTAEDGDEIQFTAFGGYGAYTFSILTNNSGATINGSTGLYTAGSTPGTDTVRVTDAQAHTTNATVVVS